MTNHPIVDDGRGDKHTLPRTAIDDAKGRKAVRAGMLAYFVDQFDIYLPIIVLAPAAKYFQAADISPGTAAILAAFVFASTLIARPIGAAVFGHFADTSLGRKKATLIAVAGFGITTLLIGLLPGYETIGIWSMVLLIALRFVDGFFLGGEYTTAVPLAMEWSPKRKRGFYSGLITAMSSGGYTAIAVITLVLLTFLPAGPLDSPYVQWGWRIPFIIGSLMAVYLYFYYLREVEESPIARTETPKVGGPSPLRALLTGKHRRSLFQVFLLMTGAWLATNMTAAALPGILAQTGNLNPFQVTAVMMTLSISVGLAYIGSGILSQRIGRRRFYIGFGVLMATLGAGAYAALVTYTANLALVFVLAVLTGVFTLALYGPIAAYITERFPADLRATGYGVSYSLALIIPAFYGLYLSGLSNWMPYQFTPPVLLVLAGICVTLGAAIGPETKEVDMTATSADAH